MKAEEEEVRVSSTKKAEGQKESLRIKRIN